MLRYVGGKTRLAKEIAGVIQTHIKPIHTEYYEPFFGDGSMAQHTKAFQLQRIASDSNCDLIYLYQRLQMGWLPREHITEDQYNVLRYDTIATATRAYAGFALSFGGKWFGGYGGRNFAAESYRRLVKHIPDIEGIIFHCMDYRYLFPVIKTSIVYADPPYASTLGYNTGKFDTPALWNTIRNWSNNGATVLVSEYEAPDDFVSVWEKPRKTYMHHKATNNEHIEHLFMWKG